MARARQRVHPESIGSLGCEQYGNPAAQQRTDHPTGERTCECTEKAGFKAAGSKAGCSTAARCAKYGCGHGLVDPVFDDGLNRLLAGLDEQPIKVEDEILPGIRDGCNVLDDHGSSVLAPARRSLGLRDRHLVHRPLTFDQTSMELPLKG